MCVCVHDIKEHSVSLRFVCVFMMLFCFWCVWLFLCVMTVLEAVRFLCTAHPET